MELEKEIKVAKLSTTTIFKLKKEVIGTTYLKA